MRGGMPSPPHVSAATALVFPAPSRRSSSAWLSPVIVALTVALAGATTGYSTSQLRQAGVAGLDARIPAVRLAGRPVRAAAIRPFVAPKPVPVADPLARVTHDPLVGPLTGMHRPLPVTVYVDGKAFAVRTTARTPAQVLTQLGVRVAPADRIIPSAGSSLWAGAKVRVVRIQRSIATKQIALPVSTVYRQDATLPRGRVVVQAGRPGAKVQRFVQTFADGRLVSATYLDQRVLRASQPRIVRAGTRVLTASRGDFAGYEYLDMVATAYAPWCCRGVDSTTSIGLRAGYGVVAVDPRIIPMGSVLYIEGYGRAIAGDVGSAIKGLRIDLGMDTIRLAKHWGRRSVRVYILKKTLPRSPAK